MSTSSATSTATASLQGIRFERDVTITGVGKTFTISRTGRFTGVKRFDGKHKVAYDYDGYGDSGFVDLDEVALYRPTPEQAAAFAAESKVGA